jgi:5'-3' exonuclease
MEIEVSLGEGDGIVIVDTSYYFFNRYFATLKWFRISTKAEVDIENLHENEEFVTAFKKHVSKDIDKFATFPYQDRPFATRVPARNKRVRNKVLFCLDCKRSDIWRMQLYEEYKSTRKPMADLNLDILAIFHEYLDTLGMCKLCADHLEADDIVYLTIKSLRTFYERLILVISNDNDFLQLFSMNVAVFNMKYENLADRMLVASDPDTCLMLKILNGDTSDNIKPIPGITKSTSMTLAKMSEEAREEYIHGLETKETVEMYNLNKKLISLSCIPKDLVCSFENKYLFRGI